MRAVLSLALLSGTLALSSCSSVRPPAAAEPAISTNNSLYLGTWQFPQRGVWVLINASGLAFQCRMANDGVVYRSNGRVVQGLRIVWDSIWVEDTLRLEGDTLFLTGPYGSFGYRPAVDSVSPKCAV